MKPDYLHRILPLAVLLVGFGLLGVGLFQQDLFGGKAWVRTQDALFYAFSAGLLAAALRRLLRIDFSRALGAGIVLTHVVMLGVVPSLVVLVLALWALALGSLILPPSSTRHGVLTLLLGLGLIAGAIGWLLPHQVHFTGVYAGIALVCILWRWGAIASAGSSLAAALRAPMQGGWECCLGLIVLGYSATAAWLPTVQSDDVGYHLALPAQLLEGGYYRFDVDSQVWAVSAWSGDTLQAVVQVLAGVEARGALNTLWLLVAAALIWQILAVLRVEVRWRWLALALFASQPTTHVLMQSMQVELPLAAVLLGIAAVLSAPDADQGPRRRTLACAGLVGLALGLKISALVFLGPLGLWFLWRIRPLPWPTLPLALVLAFLIGGSSYVYAAVLTGNPVLPLFNDVFQSPFFAVERLAHQTFLGLTSWTAPYDLVINTHRYYESRDGAAGFQWLALFGTLLLAARLRSARVLLLVGGVGLVLMYLQMQYLRYLFPALALLTIPMVQSLAEPAGGRWWGLPAVALIALNVAAMSTGSWLLATPPLSRWAYGGTATVHEYLNEFAPARLLLGYLHGAYGENYAVLFPTGAGPMPYYAEAAGHGFADTWYDPKLNAAAIAASKDASGAAYLRFLDELGITHVLLRPATAKPQQLAALRQRAVLERRQGNAALYRIIRPALVLTGLPGPDQDLIPQQLNAPVQSALSGPIRLDLEAVIHCTKPGDFVSVQIDGMARGRLRKLQLQFQQCTADGNVHYRMAVAAQSSNDLTIRLILGGNAPESSYRIESLQVRVRHDLSAERDRHRDLRL